jgi:NB-ARC domain
MHGAITGHVAVGRYVLQIGDTCGAVVREASRAERAHIRPRATPILLRPRLIRGLLDRRMEVGAAFSALDAGLPIEASGEPGIGKTALLRHLAHHPQVDSFADGIIYLPAQHQPPADLLQLIFEAFYESDEICKPTEAEIRRGLREKQALILLDDVYLSQNELEQVLDIAPRSAFVVATRERCLWGEVRSLALKGLPVEDAVLLLERELERSFDVTERSVAENLCAAIGGHPLRILQAAAITREQGTSLDGRVREISPGSLITELMASVDEKQRRALLALTALPGVPLQVQHVSGIADVTDTEAALMTLVRRGLVVSSRSGYQLADGVGNVLRRTEDLKPWVNRAITYFTAWAERYRRSPDRLLKESEALLRVQQRATEIGRWGEVLRLGRLVEGALVLGGRWGAWAILLERCLAAAQTIGDQSTETWALHETGTRAVCLGERGTACASLSRAIKLRESLDDHAGAAASRQNLNFVLAPESDNSRESARMLVDDVLDLDSLPLRDHLSGQFAIGRRRVSVLCYSRRCCWRSWEGSPAGLPTPDCLGSPGALPASVRSWLRAVSEEQRRAVRPRRSFRNKPLNCASCSSPPFLTASSQVRSYASATKSRMVLVSASIRTSARSTLSDKTACRPDR